jgi:hypothetical protein
MNKASLSVLIIAIMIPSILIAGPKDDESKKIYKGIRGGFQSSSFSVDEGDSPDGLGSYYIGIFGGKKLGPSKLLSIYSGLTLYQSGVDDNDYGTAKLTYISLPVSLRVKVGPVYAFGGANAAIKVGESLSGPIEQAENLDFKSFDAGAQIGVGVKFLMLSAELKYNFGLIEIEDGIKTTHLQAGLCLFL